MLIAIPEKNNQISKRFGRSDHFAICEINQSRIISKTYVKTNTDCEGKKNFIEFLKLHKVQLLIVNAIGEHTVDHLKAANINLIRGVSGSIDEALGQYLNGSLADHPLHCKDLQL